MFSRWLIVLLGLAGLALAPLVTHAAMPVEPGTRFAPGLTAMVEAPLTLDGPLPVYGYRVVATYPHDPQAFTQGLVYFQGDFYESTGLWGRSSVRHVDLETGQVLQQRALDDAYFGEGLTLFEDKLYQLTWKSHRGFIYDRASLDLMATFQYPTEGWGLTHDGQSLIMSDGTPHLYFLDPHTLQLQRQVMVRDDHGPVWRLNELEYIDGEVYANVWMTDRIARVDPATGRVMAWIDLSGLLSAEERAQADVLNGIAWDAEQGRLFVTGKLWPKLFQIELVPPTYTLYLNRVVNRAGALAKRGTVERAGVPGSDRGCSNADTPDGLRPDPAGCAPKTPIGEDRAPPHP